MAKRYKIHPAIGVARVGNSDDVCGYFISPELPGVPPATPYKMDGKVRRQAARFRIFEYDDSSAAPPQEIRMDSPQVSQISWTVELANRKAASDNTPTGSGPRNPTLTPAEVAIAPSARTLSAPNSTATLDDGKFRDQLVSLGEIQTESTGRLLVLGGSGTANFVLKTGEQGGYSGPNQDVLNFDNNPFWFDDTSDGPITARISFSDGTTVDADPAWVNCGPPDFAPGVFNVVGRNRPSASPNGELSASEDWA